MEVSSLGALIIRNNEETGKCFVADLPSVRVGVQYVYPDFQKNPEKLAKTIFCMNHEKLNEINCLSEF